ncbi:serine protease [bacterium]|nr:serine protease [bacterium]
MEQAKRLVAMVEVTLQGRKHAGAGVVLGVDSRTGELLVATARHVVRQGSLEASDVSVRFRTLPLAAQPARLLAADDPSRDLALLSVSVTDSLAGSIPWNRLGTARSLRFGDQLFVIGHHGSDWQHNAQPDAFFGIEESFVLFDSDRTTVGASGGGVFDQGWQIVAMALGAAGQSGRVRALPIDGIVEFGRTHVPGLDRGLGIRDADGATAAPERPPIPLPAGTERLSVGSTSAGEIPAGALEPVGFAFTPPTSGRLTFVVQNLNPRGAKGTLESVRLRESTGTPLETIGTRFLGPGSNPATSRPVATQGGQPYFLEVFPQVGTPRVPFTVAIRYEGLNVEDPREPNDVAPAAAAVRIGEMVHATVGLDGDPEDWYRVTPQETGTLVMSVRNMSPQGTVGADLEQIALYSESGMVRRAGIAARFLSAGHEESVAQPVAVQSGVSYLVRVVPRAGDVTPYLLATALEPYSIVDLGEPNGGLTEAFGVATVGVWDGLVGVGDDVRDCYRVTADRSGPLRIEVRNRNPKGTLFGGLGRVLVTDATGTTIDTIPARMLSSGANPASATISASQGHEYFVQIEPEAAGHIAWYTLRLSAP